MLFERPNNKNTRLVTVFDIEGGDNQITTIEFGELFELLKESNLVIEYKKLQRDWEVSILGHRGMVTLKIVV